MNVLALASMKGGVGKTSAAVNLAAVAADRGQRVLLWDLDPQGSATYTLGLEAGVSGGAERLVGRSKGLARAATATEVPGLWLVPADFSLRALDFALADQKQPRRAVLRLFDAVESDYDLVVLDTPTGIGPAIDTVLRTADTVIVPIVPTPLALHSYDQLIEYVQTQKRLRRVQLLAFLSMVDGRKRSHRELAESLPVTRPELLAAAIPATVDIETMADEHVPVVLSKPGSRAAEAYEHLYAEVIARLAD